MYQGNYLKYKKRINEFPDYMLNLRFLIQKITFLIKLMNKKKTLFLSTGF